MPVCPPSPPWGSPFSDGNRAPAVQAAGLWRAPSNGNLVPPHPEPLSWSPCPSKPSTGTFRKDPPPHRGCRGWASRHSGGPASRGRARAGTRRAFGARSKRGRRPSCAGAVAPTFSGGTQCGPMACASRAVYTLCSRPQPGRALSECLADPPAGLGEQPQRVSLRALALALCFGPRERHWGRRERFLRVRPQQGPFSVREKPNFRKSCKHVHEGWENQWCWTRPSSPSVPWEVTSVLTGEQS